jgi:hypothetical protein
VAFGWSVDEVCGVQSPAVNDELQHVGPAVVTGRVEVVPLLPDPVQVDVGADESLFALDRGRLSAVALTTLASAADRSTVPRAGQWVGR